MERKVERKKFPSFWISPDIQLDTPVNKTVFKKHSRSNSGKLSPYQDHSSLIKLKTALKFVTRKQSPNNSTKLKKSFKKTIPQKTSKPSSNTLQSKVKVKKSKLAKKSSAKKLKNKGSKLVVLDKTSCKKAPKIFENQIFCDIYDKKGNHDRVMETFEVSLSHGQIDEDFVNSDAKFIIASNLETEQDNRDREEYKPPENSLLMETEKDIKKNHFELFAKLNFLAQKQDCDIDCE